MNEIFLLKLGEIVLKGQNRRAFENCLKGNIRRRVKPYGDFRVYLKQSTIYVEPENDSCDLDGAWEACAAVFGIASMCRCRPCEKTTDAIYAAVLSYLGDELSMAKSFKVESKRADKSFPLNSIQLSQEIGGRLAEAFPQVAVTSTTRTTRYMWRCGTLPPTSMAPPCPAPADCPPAWAAGRRCSSPAASTPPWRAI